MKLVHGFWFPDYDDHFPKMLEKSLKKDNVLRYQWRARDFATSICDNKRIAIDIGSNVGLWSCDLVNEFEQVIGFEPVLDFRECYIRNVKKQNYILEGCALGSKESMIDMNIVQGNTGHSHINLDSVGVGSIPLKTLDSYNFTSVDLIKIDVEGFEEEILKGALNTIRINLPILVVEQQSHEYKNDVISTPAIKILESWGYEVIDQFSKDWVLKFKK